jgi:hypothetical protein
LVEDLKILLFDYHQFEDIENLSTSNLIAVDSNEKIRWYAESPGLGRIYFHIFLDDKKLFAVSGISELLELDLSNGRILSSSILK